MNYRSTDKLTNRYLSSDAFTSLKNKLGGRSITSLGSNRRRNSYRVANQGFDLLQYKSLIYRTALFIILFFIVLYIIPRTRFFIHGLSAKHFLNENTEYIDQSSDSVYNVATNFLKTDSFFAKQKENINVDNGVFVYDVNTNNIIGLTENNSSSTINIRLFSDPGFKNDLLIQQNNVEVPVSVETNATTSNGTSTKEIDNVVKEENITYKSYVFEGMGYGQLITKVPPRTEVKKDGYVYIRTLSGLKPIAQIINIDEDNKSTFTVVYSQLIVSPQNIYKVLIK